MCNFAYALTFGCCIDFKKFTTEYVQGGYDGGPFVTRFTNWLNATFPHPGHRVINLGLPAVTSALFAACYHSVPQVGRRAGTLLPAAAPITLKSCAHRLPIRNGTGNTDGPCVTASGLSV
jgi:hypothetical protein